MKPLLAIAAPIVLAVAAAAGVAWAQEPPPPAATSDVRVVADGLGGWRVFWRDNSSDETRFDVGGWLVDGPTFRIGSAPPDATSIAVPRPLPVDVAVAPGCYTAHILVFAARLNSALGLPGNVELPMCFNGERLAFPTAGAGRAPRPPAAARLPIAAAVLAGVLALCAGALMRTPRR